MTRRLALVLLVALGLVAVVAPPAPIAAEERPLYLDRARPVDERVEDLLRRARGHRPPRLEPGRPHRRLLDVASGGRGPGCHLEPGPRPGLRADVAIVVGGLNHDRFMDAEGADRKDLALPGGQAELIRRVAEAGEFRVRVGSSSRLIRLEAPFTLETTAAVAR